MIPLGRLSTSYTYLPAHSVPRVRALTKDGWCFHGVLGCTGSLFDYYILQRTFFGAFPEPALNQKNVCSPTLTAAWKLAHQVWFWSLVCVSSFPLHSPILEGPQAVNHCAYPALPAEYLMKARLSCNPALAYLSLAIYARCPPFTSIMPTLVLSPRLSLLCMQPCRNPTRMSQSDSLRLFLILEEARS